MASFVRLSRLWRAASRVMLIAGVAVMPITTAAASNVPLGTWSGTGAVLTTNQRESRIDVGTGMAIAKGPLTTDAAGRFKTTGSFEAYAPGPQRADETPVFHKAHIAGRFAGGIVELTMHVEGEKAMRKFTFKQGRVAKLVRPL